jgi:hypothetical protein
MTPDTESINRPARDTMADWQIGDLGLAVLTLTRELWVVKDRMRILEAVLEDHGIDAHQAIERYQPDEALAAELAKEGEALAARIVSSLSGDAP